MEKTEVLRRFYSNFVSHLNIAEYSNCNPPANEVIQSGRINQLKQLNPEINTAYSKYEKYSQIIPFSYGKKDEMFEEFLFLENVKGQQTSDIPSKIIIEHADLFTNYVLSGFHNSVTKF